MQNSGLSMQRHPALAFYVIAFAISWGGIFLVLARGGTPGNPDQLAKMVPIMVVAMLAGPTVASLVLTGVVGGGPGYGELRDRLLRWRVGGGWYAAALLTAPVMLMAVPLALSLLSREFLPKILTASVKGPLLLMGLVVGLAAGCFEELGWTGFVVPRLRPHLGSFGTGAIVGILWGLWHVPVNVLSCATPSGGIAVPALVGTLLFSMALLPAFRVLMVTVWDHTGSLLVAMLMHMSLTASNIILGATATPRLMAVAFNLVLAAGMWAVVAASARMRRMAGAAEEVVPRRDNDRTASATVRG